MALLALHGFTGSPRSWDFLDQREARVVPALLGHAGCDAGPEVRSFDDEVDRLAALAPETGAHVIGYSLGARLALAIALKKPERVSQLTLISCHPGLGAGERARRCDADQAWCDVLLTRGLVAFVDAWQAQPLWATQIQLPHAVRQRRQSERLSHTAEGLARSLRTTGLGQMPDYAPQLTELRMPVSLLAGALDEKFSALARQMADRLPHAELTIVEGAGHDLLLERPELVSAAIRRGNLK